MDVRKKWISSDSNYSSKEEIVSDVKENFDIRRYYSAEGKSVTIDNTTTQVIIQSHLNPLNEGKYDKKIHMPIETVVNTGSIVEWEEDKWIIVSNIDNLQAYQTASMVKSNNTLKFYDKNSILNEIPCIISKGSISLDEQKIISTLDSEIAVQISNTSITRQIEMNDVFKIGLRSSWQVTNIDDITVNGLLILRMVYSEVEPLVHTFNITIQNSDATLYVDDTLTLNIICTDNGVQVLSPTIIYLSSNINIATVVNGVITCISEGTAIISATYNGVSDSINLTVQNEVIADNYTIDITGLTTVKLGNSITLTSNVFNNGIVDLSKSVVWNLSNQDLSSNIYLSIVSYDGSSVTLKATSNSAYINKYVVVRASKSDDLSVFDEHLLQIKSLF